MRTIKRERWKLYLFEEYNQTGIKLYKLLKCLLKKEIEQEIKNELEEQAKAQMQYYKVLEKRCKKHNLL